MGDILGLGLTHYPPLSWPDADMWAPVRFTLQDDAIPESEKSPGSWPDLMRRELGDDQGLSAAAGHRAALVAGFRRCREALDDFAPDVIVVWGDDQYENFREDIIPPYCVLAYGDREIQPWDAGSRPNIWNEMASTTLKVRGRKDIALALVEGLLDRHIDISYAYEPLHHPGMAHAFLNTLLYLDYDRTGFDIPVIPFALNCYGSKVISERGTLSRFGQAGTPDPPSPSPARTMEVGAAVAEFFRESPWRVALVASSSWSHAFLCDKTYRLRPDTESDVSLYKSLVSGDYDQWRNWSRERLADAGQHELLNWFALAGAADTLGLRLEWSELIVTDLFNSNKVFACFT